MFNDFNCNRYIIIASDSNRRIWAYGTERGRPFNSEESAQRRARKMGKIIPGKDFLVVPLGTLNLKPAMEVSVNG